MPFPPNFTNVWDTTAPPDTQAANQLGSDIRNLKTDVMQRLSLLSGLYANRPTPEIVNAVWGGANYGLLYFSTDSSQVFQWNGAAWVDVSNQILGISSGISQGNARIIATVNLFNQSAPIAPTVLYAVPGGQSGVYRITPRLINTTAGTSGTFNFTITWNNGSAVKTAASQNVGIAILGDEAGFGLGIYVPSGQSISYQVGIAGVIGALIYTFVARLEYMG